jgi:predicted XRE-type DNA-binding protein
MSIQPGPFPRPGRWAYLYPESLPLEVFNDREMRLALAQRDIAKVYKLLQKYGVSQRRIARFTQQTQSEVSEIITGKRVVRSYDVLVRIADGLAIPRGWMGLASTENEDRGKVTSSGDDHGPGVVA